MYTAAFSYFPTNIISLFFNTYLQFTYDIGRRMLDIGRRRIDVGHDVAAADESPFEESKKTDKAP
jgi:hypothetical protein